MPLDNILSSYAEYNDLVGSLKQAQTTVSVTGLGESANAHFIYSLQNDLNKSALVITYTDYDAKRLYDDISFFAKDKVLYYPSKEYIFYDIAAADRANMHDRLNVLKKINSDGNFIVVASLDAVLQYTIDKKTFVQNTIDISLGKTVELEKLQNDLVIMGYVREDMVEGRGQFSVRGGILDIYPPDAENPFRIEFFDDETDSIREFDIMTQRSIVKIEHIKIIPCLETVFDDDIKADIINKLSKKAKKAGEELKQTLLTDIEKFENERCFPSIDKYVSMIYGGIPTVLDHMPEDSTVIIDEVRRIHERSKSFEWEMGEMVTDLSDRGMLLADGMDFWHDYTELCRKISCHTTVCMNVLSHTSIDFKPKQSFNFIVKGLNSFHGNLEFLYDDAAKWQERKATVCILSSNKNKGLDLVDAFNNKGVSAQYAENADDIKQGMINVLRGSIYKGFEYPLINFIMVSDREVFAGKKRKRRDNDLDSANKIKAYTDINIGDYVVHQNHGIGQYVGLQKLTVDGITKDYLKINYSGSDNLYLPTDQLDLLYKYTLPANGNVKLNKLSNNDWNKTKARVKAATADLADYLINLYSEREKTQGFAFSKDTVWQKEFEDTFNYIETEDQLRSIDEVKADMESTKPMDRLLCGDVGYGKTEVALRAAFKAVMDGKQVAYLAPTTVLAMQHYNTFYQRMKDFPVKVEMLSRFKTPTQQKQILKRLRTGETDIVIGTHKILQKNINFKDLGLLIIDEEQRFGVAHKERLKELKKNIDVLTLTATPIPRTLHMSMINIRDMSVLNEPPEDRYPVQTYVLEKNMSVLIDAIKAELAREGQVYYLVNRVQGIEHVAQQLALALPDARIQVAHGQMKESELEDIMVNMQNGEVDVLVCTTIIETGLDIPNVNTIIIENADRLGLAQLYQLRGRVGRSNRKAYAYLTYQPSKLLNDVAQKRLQAIKEFTEFGSGFKIAMRDMEIRGAGNVLGSQQHGHIDAVGYDMYCKILHESINEAQGKTVAEESHALIDITVSAFISEKYINNHTQRIDIYKKISYIETQDDAYEVQEEIEDRFGDLPKEVQNLIDIALIKSMAVQSKVYEVVQKGDNVIFKIYPDAVNMKVVAGLNEVFGTKILLSAGEKPYLTYRMNADDKKRTLENIKFILQEFKRLQNDNNV